MTSIEDIQAMMKEYPPVELHPDLIQCLERTGRGKGGWQMLRHPVVYGVPYIKELNKHYNQMYEQKKLSLEEAEKAGNWSSYIFLHERPYRIAALEQNLHLMTHDQRLEMIESVWVDSENIYQNVASWRRLLSRMVVDRGYLPPNEVVKLPKDGQTLRIYRGICVPKDHRFPSSTFHLGNSWTTDEDKARWFSRRFYIVGDLSIVMTAEISVSRVVMKLDDRGENEIVVLSKDLINPEPMESWYRSTEHDCNLERTV